MSKIGLDFNAGHPLPAECSQAGDVPPACADASAGREAACFGPVASLPAADRDGEGAKTRSERSHDGVASVAPACPTGSQAGREYAVFLRKGSGIDNLLLEHQIGIV